MVGDDDPGGDDDGDGKQLGLDSLERKGKKLNNRDNVTDDSAPGVPPVGG